jgi:hypothetical protein
MTDADDPDLSVDEFVDYCRTQARFLSGSIQTMGAEADDLLDEIDEEMAAIRRDLRGEGPSVEHTDSPESTERPEESDVDVAAIEEREAAIETKQAEVEAKQARMDAYQELANGYTALAGELAADVGDGQAAMSRVLAFEAEHDAPAYFEEQTVLEAAAAAADAGGE